MGHPPWKDAPGSPAPEVRDARRAVRVGPGGGTRWLAHCLVGAHVLRTHPVELVADLVESRPDRRERLVDGAKKCERDQEVVEGDAVIVGVSRRVLLTRE